MAGFGGLLLLVAFAEFDGDDFRVDAGLPTGAIRPVAACHRRVGGTDSGGGPWFARTFDKGT
jgi:hypothetical protein